jgi:hypothetical protein
MNVLTEIRRANLRAIVDRDGLSSAAKRFGKPDRQINDMLAGRKSFGEKVARAMEAAYDPSRPLGWLDAPQQEDDVSLLPSSNSKATDAKAQSSTIGGGHMPSAQVVQFASRDHITIPQYDAGGAMGHGLVLPEQPGVIERWTVNSEWLDKNARGYTSARNLCIVTGFGPSMRPMFNPGDPLLVDRGITSVQADGVYFFRIGAEGFIKQLQKIPTANGVIYRAKSANADYDPFDITFDMDFEVLGKVIRVWCGTDF